MKLYAVTDEYINYLRRFESKVYDIPVPKSELILYEAKNEKNKNYKILIEKELEFIGKNEGLIKKYASILYKQKINEYDVSYIKNVVNFKLLEEKCLEYKKVK